MIIFLLKWEEIWKYKRKVEKLQNDYNVDKLSVIENNIKYNVSD